jgi:hypothetical protein
MKDQIFAIIGLIIVSVLVFSSGCTNPPQNTMVIPGTTVPQGLTVIPGTTVPQSLLVIPGTTVPQRLTVIPNTSVLQRTTSPRNTVAPQNQEEKNIATVKGIIEEYHRTHTYLLADMYTCAQMSQDVWDEVETQGITAVIYLGSVDKDISTIEDADHAWVLAEVAPGEWIALETTGGFLVCGNANICSVNNPRYFSGFKFDNPKEVQDALDALKYPCDAGYVLGSDNLCHMACGGNAYCTGDSICVNGQCKGCNSGYILGQDLICHQECPGGSGKYCSTGICHADGKCYSY